MEEYMYIFFQKRFYQPVSINNRIHLNSGIAEKYAVFKAALPY